MTARAQTTAHAEPTDLYLGDLATYRPENRVPAAYFAQFAQFALDDDLADNVMFRAPAHRHHAGADKSNADMMVAAAQRLIARHGAGHLDDVDIVVTHSQLPEVPVRGSRANWPTVWACAPPRSSMCTTEAAPPSCT